jgi:hypothetical protein
VLLETRLNLYIYRTCNSSVSGFGEGMLEAITTLGFLKIKPGDVVLYLLRHRVV